MDRGFGVKTGFLRDRQVMYQRESIRDGVHSIDGEAATA